MGIVHFFCCNNDEQKQIETKQSNDNNNNNNNNNNNQSFDFNKEYLHLDELQPTSVDYPKGSQFVLIQ